MQSFFTLINKLMIVPTVQQKTHFTHSNLNFQNQRLIFHSFNCNINNIEMRGEDRNSLRRQLLQQIYHLLFENLSKLINFNINEITCIQLKL